MGIGTDVLSTIAAVFSRYYAAVMDNISSIITGALIIIIGYFIAKIAGLVVRKILYRVNLDKKLRKADLDDSFGKVSLARLFGTLTQWFLFFVFFALGLPYLSVGALTAVAHLLARWTFIITGDIILIVVGFIFIDFVLYKVWEIRSKYDRPVQMVARILLVIIVLFTTLEQQGVNIDFLQNIFLLIFTAMLLSISLAVGIGLGIGIGVNASGAFKKLGKKKRR